MAHDDLILPEPNLRRPVAMSATLHGLVMAAVVLSATSDAQRVERDEQVVAARAAAAQAAQVVQEIADAKRGAAAAAAGGVRAELDAALGGVLSADPALAEEVGEDLESFFAAHDLADLDSQEAGEMLAAARQQALKDLEGQLEQRMRAALVAEVRAHIRAEVAPELAARVADELERRLDGPAREAARRGGLGALAAAEPKVVAAATAAITTEAVPAAARRVVDSVREGLKRLGEDPARFEELVAGDIRTALDESLAGAGQKTVSSAFSEARRQLGETASTAKAAQDAATSAASQLSRLASRERALRSTAGDPAPGEGLAEQRAIAAEITAAERAAREAARAARMVGSAADAAAARTAEALRNSQAGRQAKAAADSWQAGAIEETRQAMGQVADDLERTARALNDVAGDLAKAAAGNQQGGTEGNAGDALAAAGSSASTDAARQAGSQVEVGQPFGADGEVSRLAAARERLRQLAANAESGRVPATTDLAGVGLGLGGSGSGAGNRTGNGVGARSRYNREAYEAFVKDLRARAAPGNLYGADQLPEGLVASAPVPELTPPRLWFPAPRPAVETPAEKRTLTEPTFPHAAFGALGYQAGSITLDGELGDWGELAHPMAMRFHHEGAKIENGTEVFVRWNADGLYFAWKVRKSGDPVPCPEQPYLGDALEVWIDCDNGRRSAMSGAAASHQFIFCPFGTRGDATATFAEVGRGLRGLRSHQSYLDTTQARGAAIAKRTSDGYQAEAMIRVSTLARPALVPGQWLAMNFSVNTSRNILDGTQWSAPKSIHTWDKPDTWGDVLLLGADAKLSFRDPVSPDKPAPCAAVGWPLCVEVADGDMDLDRSAPDRIAVELTGEGGQPVLAILAETGATTGVFRGNVATQNHLAAVEPAAVPLRPGSTVTLTYRDPRAGYGERDRTVTAVLPVGVPVSNSPGAKP